MSYISIDLGTTNIKVAFYDKKINLISDRSENVEYFSEGDWVEFDAEQYFDTVTSLIGYCIEDSNISSNEIIKIVLTGQAESLIALNKDNKPIRKGISWLDMRSGKECDELKEVFPKDICYRITGQQSIIPTWPITKMLWLRKNEPEIFSNVDKYLMLKDYIQFRLTGKIVGEYSIYNFTHYFDINKKDYWTDILTYCGIKREQLPELVEPFTDIGVITDEMSEKLGVSPDSTVNVGTLDHFSGMIGTGNVKKDIISVSTGTVLAITTLVDSPPQGGVDIPCHYGPFKDTYVLMLVCESGGASLEWYKKGFLPDIGYEKMNEEILKKELPNELIFLPYIAGVNAPDYNEKANGVFYGIKSKHDKFDLAYAIMEGVSHLFAININFMKKIGVDPKMVISTGGGSRSDLWSQLYSDISKNSIVIPENEEAGCLGVALMASVIDGVYTDLDQAIKDNVNIKKRFTPKSNPALDNKHRLFSQVLNSVTPVFLEGALETS